MRPHKLCNYKLALWRKYWKIRHKYGKKSNTNYFYSFIHSKIVINLPFCFQGVKTLFITKKADIIKGATVTKPINERENYGVQYFARYFTQKKA